MDGEVVKQTGFLQKMKEYNLTKEEREGLENRHLLIKQYQYLIHCINEEIITYTNLTVCKRVGLKEGQGYKLSPDNKKIILEDNDTVKTK